MDILFQSIAKIKCTHKDSAACTCKDRCNYFFCKIGFVPKTYLGILYYNINHHLHENLLRNFLQFKVFKNILCYTNFPGRQCRNWKKFLPLRIYVKPIFDQSKSITSSIVNLVQMTGMTGFEDAKIDFT